MRIIYLLLIVGICLVSAKYIPHESSATDSVLQRVRRSDSDDTDSKAATVERDDNSSNENDNDDDDDNGSVERKAREDEKKRLEKEEKKRQKALEKLEKEREKEIQERRKLEEKIAKEQRKQQERQEKEERKLQERLEKERRKLEEEQQKMEEKVKKEEKKRQEKLKKQLEEIQKDLQESAEDSYLETEEEDSVEIEDVWKAHVYENYGITVTSTKLERQAALQRYLHDELGINANSTKSERRQAILKLIQTKLLNDSASMNSFRNLFLSQVNAAQIQKLRLKLDKDMEELNNKTELLNNVSLPWASVAQQNIEEKRTFLQAIAQFLSNIVPNWLGGQTPTNVVKPSTSGSNDQSPSALPESNLTPGALNNIGGDQINVNQLPSNNDLTSSGSNGNSIPTSGQPINNALQPSGSDPNNINLLSPNPSTTINSDSTNAKPIGAPSSFEANSVTAGESDQSGPNQLTPGNLGSFIGTTSSGSEQPVNNLSQSAASDDNSVVGLTEQHEIPINIDTPDNSASLGVSSSTGPALSPNNILLPSSPSGVDSIINNAYIGQTGSNGESTNIPSDGTISLQGTSSTAFVQSPSSILSDPITSGDIGSLNITVEHNVVPSDNNAIDINGPLGITTSSSSSQSSNNSLQLVPENQNGSLNGNVVEQTNQISSITSDQNEPSTNTGTTGTSNLVDDILPGSEDSSNNPKPNTPVDNSSLNSNVQVDLATQNGLSNVNAESSINATSLDSTFNTGSEQSFIPSAPTTVEDNGSLNNNVVYEQVDPNGVTLSSGDSLNNLLQSNSSMNNGSLNNNIPLVQTEENGVTTNTVISGNSTPFDSTQDFISGQSVNIPLPTSNSPNLIDNVASGQTEQNKVTINPEPSDFASVIDSTNTVSSSVSDQSLSNPVEFITSGIDVTPISESTNNVLQTGVISLEPNLSSGTIIVSSNDFVNQNELPTEAIAVASSGQVSQSSVNLDNNPLTTSNITTAETNNVSLSETNIMSSVDPLDSTLTVLTNGNITSVNETGVNTVHLNPNLEISIENNNTSVDGQATSENYGNLLTETTTAIDINNTVGNIETTSDIVASVQDTNESVSISESSVNTTVSSTSVDVAINNTVGNIVTTSDIVASVQDPNESVSISESSVSTTVSSTSVDVAPSESTTATIGTADISLATAPSTGDIINNLTNQSSSSTVEVNTEAIQSSSVSANDVTQHLEEGNSNKSSVTEAAVIDNGLSLSDIVSSVASVIEPIAPSQDSIIPTLDQNSINSGSQDGNIVDSPAATVPSNSEGQTVVSLNNPVVDTQDTVALVEANPEQETVVVQDTANTPSDSTTAPAEVTLVQSDSAITMPIEPGASVIDVTTQ